MRRASVFALILAALGLPSPAGADLIPIPRGAGELEAPRARPAVPPAAARPSQAGRRVTVVLRLGPPPLAAWRARSVARDGATTRRLDVRAPASRQYLRSLAANQRAAELELRKAVPSARVTHRHRILLDALSVEVPADAVPRLAELDGVSRVYPSLAYTMALDRSPGVVGVPVIQAGTGASGEGVKIGIIDDGIDQANPFFDPGRLEFPPGFPKGRRGHTTRKVIVARSFPGPGAGAAGKLPFDPQTSFHGTHVAGIAAGAADTTAPKGPNHPKVLGLSGVAPHAWLGNYRVFTVPTRGGNVANTPELLAALEAAVRDGMDVINFSGGGPEVEPTSDALIEAIENVALAGVVPVVSAGNRRDFVGAGSVGSPGTAPAAITVGAVSNDRIFRPRLSVIDSGAPPALRAIPYAGSGGVPAPGAWEITPQVLVDVSSLAGVSGGPVPRELCSPSGDLSGRRTPLAPNALDEVVALVWRGGCTLSSKADRARRAGASGIVLVDNRPGEAGSAPSRLGLPSVMISDLDGAALADFASARGGAVTFTASRARAALTTDRSGVVTSFSAPGPTAFDHALKPDVAAPGDSIISSTAGRVDRSRFSVLSGTSMAAPHVAGGAALLLELHPTLSPQQVKSAVVSTATAAFADTARTSQAPVTLAGAGLLDLAAASDPRILTAPATVSFGDLPTRRSPARRAVAITVADAGGGAGAWNVQIRPDSQVPGVTLTAPAAVTVPAGGQTAMVLALDAQLGTPASEVGGHIVLSRDGAERSVPFLALVSNPRLAGVASMRLRGGRQGTTRGGSSRVGEYRYPTAPLGSPASPGDPPLVETGTENVFRLEIDRPVVNAGVVVESLTARGIHHPFLLAGKDENSVLGLAGTPANVNPLTETFLGPVGAAGVTFPRPGRYWVAVDSPRDLATGETRSGPFRIRAWLDDLTPPRIELLTPRLGNREATIALRVLDRQSGVDPGSLSVTAGGLTVGASRWDPEAGVALFPIPRTGAPLRRGSNAVTVRASDNQEAKNAGSTSTRLPNTSAGDVSVRLTTRRLAVWLLPPTAGACVRRGQQVDLAAIANGPATVRRVAFRANGRLLGTVERRLQRDVFVRRWHVRARAGSTLAITATAVDRRGESLGSRQRVRVCKR